jgi:nucleotide-binding universal stress UspA family protein
MHDSISFRSILAATDLSRGSGETLAAAAALAASTGAALHVVHAVAPERGEAVLRMQRRIHDARAALRAQIGEIPGGTAPASGAVVFERPAAGILARAREVGADLLVIGPHRPRGVGDQVLGTTADDLVRRSSVPCLIVRGPLAQRLRRIVVASDLTPVSEGALAVAIRLARTLRSVEPSEDPEVTLLHVETDRPSEHAGFGQRFHAWLELDREASLAREAAGGDAPRIEQKVVTGPSPQEEIMRYARESGADLLVMGTRGDRPLVKVLLGSVSAAVARATETPLLLLPPAVWGVDARRGITGVPGAVEPVLQDS